MKYSQIVKKCLSHLKLNKITLGNVEFWIDKEDFCYSIPTSQWDQKSINDDLTKIIIDNQIEIF